MSDSYGFPRMPPAPFRIAFDAARDPYTARNALGITSLGGGGAPVGAQYITAVADPTLTAERVLTNTATITWDFSTAGQAKANAAVGGGGNVSNSGTPTLGQYAKWVTATTIQGVAPATVLSDIGAQPAGNYQPLDGDLTSLAAAAGTNTIYYRSAANTWTPVVVSTGLAFSGGNLTATAGGGNVSNSGTPTAGQVAEWVTATTIAGVSTYAKLASPALSGTPTAPTAGAGTNTTQVATTAFVAANAIRTVAIQMFTASGTYTPTAGMKFCIIEAVGGGGGGGGLNGAANLLGCGSGGGSGGYSRKRATAADIGVSQTVTIGASGTGVSNAAGTAGGNTSVGSLCVANGGGGGGPMGNPGGAGAAVGTGDVAAAGSPGEGGFYNNNYPAVNIAHWTGFGGSGPWGGGAPAVSTGTTAAGANASNYGSGGGGGVTLNFGTTQLGGNGSPGIVIITEYI